MITEDAFMLKIDDSILLFVAASHRGVTLFGVDGVNVDWSDEKKLPGALDPDKYTVLHVDTQRKAIEWEGTDGTMIPWASSGLLSTIERLSRDGRAA